MQPDAAEPGRMQEFAEALLRQQGALVEPIEPEGLEVLAPPEVQHALGVGELARLGFGTTLPPAAQRVGMESDWLDRFARLLGPQGRRSRRVLPLTGKAPGDPERVLEHELVLDNATFRLLEVTPAWTRYLVMDFRASAVSDDKRDFMLRVGINMATGALPDTVLTAIGPLIDHEETTLIMPDNADPPAIWDRTRVLGVLARALPARLDAALGPFVKGLRRRLGRDQDRLHQYHNDLYCDALRRAAVLPEGDPKRAREEQRAAAIEREYRAKLDDLARQYATRVTIEWVQTLELIMPVHRFAVQIRRRKADRTIHLDWNPLARRLEPPVCEATFSAERPRLVCDDALHLVVPAALAACSNCGRAYCRACHAEACPKCGAAEPARALSLGNWAGGMPRL
ncbi:hypothetical protein [Rhodopila sp.]|uniref:hypothetical protein n=1 Tax=Rhodopila sp. TaxID=2480087 RepID=UPI003D0C98F6